MSYNLFLDDIRDPSQVGNYMYPVELRAQYRLEDWMVVRNFDEFTDYVRRNGIPKKVSFDHDLAAIHYDPQSQQEHFEYYEKTGLDCVKWLCTQCILTDQKFPEYYLHSANPVGVENMRNYIENHKRIMNELEG